MLHYVVQYTCSYCNMQYKRIKDRGVLNLFGFLVEYVGKSDFSIFILQVTEERKMGRREFFNQTVIWCDAQIREPIALPLFVGVFCVPCGL